jgi:hypothetical protein
VAVGTTQITNNMFLSFSLEGLQNVTGFGFREYCRSCPEVTLHTHTHTRARARTHTHTRTRTHFPGTPFFALPLSRILSERLSVCLLLGFVFFFHFSTVLCPPRSLPSQPRPFLQNEPLHARQCVVGPPSVASCVRNLDVSIRLSLYLTLTTLVQFVSYLGPRIVFPLEPKAKKPLLALFLKSNSQFSLHLTL